MIEKIVMKYGIKDRNEEFTKHCVKGILSNLDTIEMDISTKKKFRVIILDHVNQYSREVAALLLYLQGRIEDDVQGVPLKEKFKNS